MSKKALANKPFNSDKLAKAIIAKRTADDLSLNDAAEATGTSKMTIFRVESKKRLDVETLVIFSNWLEVPVQTFFS